MVGGVKLFSENFALIDVKSLDEKRLKQFLEESAQYNSKLLAYVLIFCKERDFLLSLLENFFRKNMDVWCDIIQHSVELRNGNELFKALERKKLLLDFGKVHVDGVMNVEGVKWMESNGVDVVKSSKIYPSEEVMEYLLNRGMTIEQLKQKVKTEFTVSMLRVMLKFFGVEEVKKHVKPSDMCLHFEALRLLTISGFQIEKKDVANSTFGPNLYAFLCFELLKWKDLNKRQQKEVRDFLRTNDVKAVNHMIHLMKPVRKKKIMAVLICMKKIPLSYPLPKEIIWNILDYAYSPINQRGSR